MSVVRGSVIAGDNRRVLEELLNDNTSITCAYLDPPYNNGDRLFAYRDKEDADVWLCHMEECAWKIHRLLTDHGSLWISIDDGMMHYLKVALDKIFGRDNFLTTISWEHRKTRENRATFSKNHEYILVYAKDARKFKSFRGGLQSSEARRERFKNPDNDPRGPWQSVSATVQAGHSTASQHYSFRAPDGRLLEPPKGRCWIYSRDRMEQEVADGRIYFGRNGSGVPRLKKFLSESSQTVTPQTLWTADDCGTTAIAKKHILSLDIEGIVFDTPKPEQLIARILEIASRPGDIVLDAFAGSGTTLSVAHKMGRRYVGIELNNEVASQCVQRLRSVCGGEQGGISKAVAWAGGGNFSYLRSA